MQKTFGSPVVPNSTRKHRVMSILLWVAVSTGWLVSVFSVIEEMCMVSACRDTAGFTIFGFNMGWFGIAYFSLILIVLWLHSKIRLLTWALDALVFSGIGAELRLLWIQKYIIGGWCPLCVTICCALFVTFILLIIERIRGVEAGQDRIKYLLAWVAFWVAMVATGLAIAIVGVKALT